MDVSVIPGFHPSPQAYAPAVKVYGLMQEELRSLGITSDQDADLFTALTAGLISQQLANDPALTLDAIDFCRAVARRPADVGLGDLMNTEVPF